MQTRKQHADDTPRVAARVRHALVAIIMCVCMCPSEALAGARAQPAGSVARPTTPIAPGGCVTTECHPGVAAKRFVHAPISAGSCDACHTLKDAGAHTFVQARAREEACTLCHMIKTDGAATIHKPYAERECLSCHDPHTSSESALLRSDRYADTCLGCHTDVTHAKSVVHGPASVGACGACHQPHASRSRKLLNAEGRELCLKCHESVQSEIISAPLVHEPLKGECLVCHDPHAGSDRAMLTTDPNALCTSCHQNVLHDIQAATTQHAAVTTSRECLNCHSAHSAHRSRLLRKDESELCLECHSQEITLASGTKIRSMKGVLASGKSLHGAVAQRNCSVCHDIHGGGHRRLLKGEYPGDVYRPFAESAYSLCFSCHDKQRVLDAKSTTATQFRNGDTNLHFVHVNRDSKGRTCRVCHDAHAASRDKYIHQETSFGPQGWKLPIRFVRTASGGSCGAGCHAAIEYNRDVPVSYPALRTGEWKGDGLVAPAGTSSSKDSTLPNSKDNHP